MLHRRRRLRLLQDGPRQGAGAGAGAPVLLRVSFYARSYSPLKQCNLDTLHAERRLNDGIEKNSPQAGAFKAAMADALLVPEERSLAAVMVALRLNESDKYGMMPDLELAKIATQEGKAHGVLQCIAPPPDELVKKYVFFFCGWTRHLFSRKSPHSLDTVVATFRERDAARAAGVPSLFDPSFNEVYGRLRVHAANGCLSDDPAVSLYQNVPGSKWYGLQRMVCLRNESACETVFSRSNLLVVGSNLSLELLDLYLLWFAVDYNLKMRARSAGEPDLPHAQLWHVERLNRLRASFGIAPATLGGVCTRPAISTESFGASDLLPNGGAAADDDLVRRIRQRFADGDVERTLLSPSFASRSAPGVVAAGAAAAALPLQAVVSSLAPPAVSVVPSPSSLLATFLPPPPPHRVTVSAGAASASAAAFPSQAAAAAAAAPTSVAPIASPLIAAFLPPPLLSVARTPAAPVPVAPPAPSPLAAHQPPRLVVRGAAQAGVPQPASTPAAALARPAASPKKRPRPAHVAHPPLLVSSLATPVERPEESALFFTLVGEGEMPTTGAGWQALAARFNAHVLQHVTALPSGAAPSLRMKTGDVLRRFAGVAARRLSEAAAADSPSSLAGAGGASGAAALGGATPFAAPFAAPSFVATAPSFGAELPSFYGAGPAAPYLGAAPGFPPFTASPSFDAAAAPPSAAAPLTAAARADGGAPLTAAARAVGGLAGLHASLRASVSGLLPAAATNPPAPVPPPALQVPMWRLPVPAAPVAAAKGAGRSAPNRAKDCCGWLSKGHPPKRVDCPHQHEVKPGYPKKGQLPPVAGRPIFLDGKGRKRWDSESGPLMGQV